MEQPQIFELLKTEFGALILGHRDGEDIRQILPPQPPRIHSFVYACSAQEVAEFTSALDYLRSVLGFAHAAQDELLIAVARGALAARDERDGYVVQVGKELSRLIREDYDRLGSLVRRIAQ